MSNFDQVLAYLRHEPRIQNVEVVQLGDSKAITYVYDGKMFNAVRFIEDSDSDSDFIVELQLTTEETYEEMFEDDYETVYYPSFNEWYNCIESDLNDVYE